MSEASTPAAVRMSLRLTGEERLALEEMAGGVNLSAYIRAQIFGQDCAKRKRGSARPVKDHEALAQVLGMLGQSDIATSLAALAKAAQAGAVVIDEESTATLESCSAELADIRALLMTALRVKSD